MFTKCFVAWLQIAALVLVALATGCASTDKSSEGDRSGKPSGMEGDSKPMPAKAATPAAYSDGEMSHISMAFPTGDPDTSAVLLKKSVPSTVRANQEYDYTLSVTNLTSLPLEGVAVTEDITENMSIKSSTPQGQAQGANKVVWQLGALGPHETKSIRVRGAAGRPGNATSCASVVYNASACLTTRVVDPALKLEKRAPAEVLACEPIPMTFVVTNTGTGEARNVRITDDLPAGLRTREGASKVDLPVGTLTSGQSREVKVMVMAEKAGSYNNKAMAVADGGLEAASNTTTTRVRQPVLEITKKGPERSFAGGPLTYDITVRNTGDGEAREAMVEDQLPVNSTFVSASDGGQNVDGRVVWNLRTLPAGEARTLKLTIRANTIGMIRNTATAKAFCAKSVSADASTDIQGIPAILLEVVDVEDPIRVGDEVTYIITVTNQGSATGTNIRIRCGLEGQMQLVAATGATNAPSARAGSSTTVDFSPLASLPPQAKASWQVKVKATKPGDVRFRVSMDSDQLGRSVDETEATNFYE